MTKEPLFSQSRSSQVKRPYDEANSESPRRRVAEEPLGEVLGCQQPVLHSLLFFIVSRLRVGMKQFIVPQYFFYVGTGFSNARNFAIFDPMDPSIIGR